LRDDYKYGHTELNRANRKDGKASQEGMRKRGETKKRNAFGQNKDSPSTYPEHSTQWKELGLLF
jgi:hypothetical protein